MKPWKIVSIVVVFILFVAFFTMRPVREKACPLTQANLNNDPDFARHCTLLGGVVVDGKCTCPS